MANQNTPLVILAKDKDQNSVPVTTSEIIANALDKEHKDVILLLKKYLGDFKPFGSISFKTKMINAGKGAQRKKEIAILNEQQSTLLITYMRNSEKVRMFKVALVKAFFDMRQQLQLQNQPKTDSLPNYYTADQIKELKDKARRQGYAIACQYLKKDENGLTPFDRKELQKALTVIDWLESKRIDMHNAWKEQREIARQLRELTYKYEQSSDILSLMFGGYVGTASEVSHYLTDKLKQDS